MNTEQNFQHLEHEESSAVVSFGNGTTFRLSKLMEKINDFFTMSVLSQLSKLLTESGLGTPPNHGGSFNQSVNAEILEPKSGEWKKGKVRMRVVLEFCLDEQEEIKSDPIQSANSLYRVLIH